MNRKYFAVSDVHGHAALLQEALREAGFDRENENHVFLSCGDLFDRGRENRAVYEFVKSLPRKILLRGNHEDLLEDVLESGRITVDDVYNGLSLTVGEFFGKESIDRSGLVSFQAEVLAELRAFLSEMLDYYETEHFVFTHGWIPTLYDGKDCSLWQDWRVAPYSIWGEARYSEWQAQVRRKLFVPGKTIVCGHRPAAFGAYFDPARDREDSRIFYGEGVAAIDAWTIRSGKINVLVAEEPEPVPQNHSMKLQAAHFDAVKNGGKKIEMRLWDEKRQRLRPGDSITFQNEETGERLLKKILGLYLYDDFEALASDFSPDLLGFPDREINQIVAFMGKLYGERVETKKALAIRFGNE